MDISIFIWELTPPVRLPTT